MHNHIYLVCGIPCSGKDYFVEHELPASVIESFDKIRIAEYKRSGLEDLTKLSDHEIYQKAWEFCNEKKIDLMKPLLRNVENALILALTPCICNTLLTRKSRASMINALKQKFPNISIHCIFLTVDSKTAMSRNASRMSHRLSDEVMNRFINGPQELPTKDEGFESVKIIHNS